MESLNNCVVSIVLLTLSCASSNEEATVTETAVPQWTSTPVHLISPGYTDMSLQADDTVTLEGMTTVIHNDPNVISVENIDTLLPDGGILRDFPQRYDESLNTGENGKVTLHGAEVFISKDNKTISQVKDIISLLNDLINVIGNDTMTSHLTNITSSMWNEMLTPEWDFISVTRWSDRLNSLRGEIMSSLAGLPINPTWNLTMITLWNDRMISQLSNFTSVNTFSKDSEVVPPEEEEIVEVVLKQGAISAKIEKAGEDRFFYSFQGIPFAQPPIGRLRFRDPVPSSFWKGTRDGSIPPPICPQLQYYITVGKEDCLYLNVYTPRPYKSDLPVMVWIHGEHFVAGGANEYPPLPLLTKDVVLVTIQYRLGTLGFLSTEDSVMPGNLGLKDQTLALHWVQNNIHDLGGDPNKVTVFGESAGAASAHLQVLSPKAKGLFQRVIMQSGSALSPWALRTDHRKIATEVGHHYNCSTGYDSLDSIALLECLQALPLSDIVEIPSLFTMIVSLPVVMTPRVDGDFLPDHPATLLREGKYNKVDVITGVNKHEGAIVTLPFVLNPWLVKELMENFGIAGPALMSLEKEESPEDLARQIYHHYLKGQAITTDTVEDTVKMASDLAYKADHDEVARIHAGDAVLGKNTYSYELQYRGQYGFTDLYGPDAGKHWITHGDDLPYLFNSRLIVLQQPEDLLVRELMVTLWTNFAFFGNPTPDNTLDVRWLPVTPSNLQYLSINTRPFMQDYDRASIMEFWNSLPTQTNQLLSPERSYAP